MFGKSNPFFAPLKNLAEVASEQYQELINCYFRHNPESADNKETEVIKSKGVAQSGTNASLPGAYRGLAIGAFTPSVGSAGGMYAVWDKSSTDSQMYKLGAGDPTSQGISAYLPTQDTDGEFEQVNDNLYYTNGVDAVVKLTGSTGVWSQMAVGAPLSGSGTVAKYLAWYNYMLFGARTVNAPNILYVSDAGTPETFTGPVTKTFRYKIIGLKVLDSYLMVYTEKETWAVTGTTPSTLSYRLVSDQHPTVAHRSIVPVIGGAREYSATGVQSNVSEHWFLAEDYVWATNGSTFRILGKESWEMYRTNLSTAQLSHAAAVFDTFSGQYLLSVPTGSATKNTVTWAYDAIADKWVEKPLHTFSCYAVHGSPTPSIYALDSNATGRAYVLNSGNALETLQTTTNGSHTATVTTITVASTTGFPSTGVIQVENEVISYTGTTATEFTGCIRGYQGTTAATHATSKAVTPALQFRYRTRNLNFGATNLIKKFQVLWVNVKPWTVAYSLSVNVNVDQGGFSLAKNVPLLSVGMTWGTDTWGSATWGAPEILLTPTNRTAITGRGKSIAISFDESSSLNQTEIIEAELRLRPLKRK